MLKLIDPDLVVSLLKYGSYAMGFGILVVAPAELLIYGALKAMGFFRL